AEDDAAGHGDQRERHREGHALAEEVGQRALDDVEIKAHQSPACGAPPAAIRPGTRTRCSRMRMRSTTTRLVRRYITVAAVKASNTRKLNSCIARARPVSSRRPMVSATEEFLMMFIDSEVSGGRMMRKACGRIT